ESVNATSDGGNTEESGSNSSATVKLAGGKGSVSSGTSGSSAGRSKRYSNNLFGSGRLRDYTYLRSVSASRDSGGASKTASIVASEESANTNNTSSRTANTSS